MVTVAMMVIIFGPFRVVDNVACLSVMLLEPRVLV